MLHSFLEQEIYNDEEAEGYILDSQFIMGEFGSTCVREIAESDDKRGVEEPITLNARQIISMVKKK